MLPIIIGQFLRPRLGEKVDGWKPRLSTFSSFTLLVIIYTTFCNTFCDGVCTSTDIRNPFSNADSLHPPNVGSTTTRPSHVSMFHQGGQIDSSRRALFSLRGSSLNHQLKKAGLLEAGIGLDSHLLMHEAQQMTPVPAQGAGRGVFGELSTNALLVTCGVVVSIQVVLMFLAYGISSSKRVQRLLKVDWTRPDVVAIIFSSVHKSLTLGVPVLKIVFASSPILPLLSLPLLMYHPIQIVVGGMAAPSIKKWVLLQGVVIGVDRAVMTASTNKLQPNITPTKATV